MIRTLLKKLTYTQLIAISFLIVILLGACLLCLPQSTRDHSSTPFLHALFTATSATCVTGLIVYDTYTHWSLFGQIVILMLIQIGGLGFMTIVTMLRRFFKRNISLSERKLIMQTSGTLQLNSSTPMLSRIFLGTLFFEGAGTIILSFCFCPQMGLWEGIYNALFHSVSAFCNAGFDILGKYGEFSSLTTYVNNVPVTLTIGALIVIGGLGFMVWDDIAKNGFHFKKYEFHTKIVLTTTTTLILLGWGLFFIFEYNASMSHLTLGEKVLASLFQSITPRTAGFNSVDINQLSQSGYLLTTVLMLIGGSPGSTAGGIKTTTFAVLIMSTIAAARQKGAITLFKRKLRSELLVQASAIFMVYLTALGIGTLIICAAEPFMLEDVIFECVSAIGTVGLSCSISSMAAPITHIILTLLMYFGRIGGLSIMCAIMEPKNKVQISRPEGEIVVG